MVVKASQKFATQQTQPGQIIVQSGPTTFFATSAWETLNAFIPIEIYTRQI